MIKFEPQPGIAYRYNYNQIFSDIVNNKIPEKDAIRSLILSDLFFIVNFIFKIPGANRKFVVDACADVESRKFGWNIYLWSRYHFKAVSINEPVPTPGGWKSHGELVVGDYVFGIDGLPVKILAKTEIFEKANCYRVTFDKGYSVVVSEDHLWDVNVSSKKRIQGNKREGKKRKVINTIELKKELELSQKYKTRILPSVDVCQPVQYEEKELPIQPYTLGAWLGDGTSAGGMITCAYSDLEILKNIENEGVGVIERKSSNDNSGLFSLDKGIRGKKGTGLTSKLRKLGVINNKHIPVIYKQSSILQRFSLLQGLMDTDGSCDTRGTATFCNINKTLASDVFEIAASLGLKPSLRKHVGKFNGNPYQFYNVSFQSKIDSLPVFRLNRKQMRVCASKRTRSNRHAIIKVEAVDKTPCSCIQVDSEDGQYLIGKHFIPTHNSTIITKARTLQRILSNPERTVMIISHTRPMAKKFLRPLMLEMEMNPVLKSVFSNELYKNPRAESPKWSEDDGCIIKRTSLSRSEATIEAWGIKDGMPIGVHFDDIVIDDLETKDVVQNPEVVIKAREAVDLCRFLLSEGGGIDIVGTPYSHEGIYYPFIIDKKRANGSPLFNLSKKPATEDGTKAGKPVLLSREEIDDLAYSMGEYEFNSQMLINPTPTGTRTLDSRFLQEIDVKEIPKRVLKFMVVDPAGDGVAKRNDSWSILVCAVEPQLDNLGLSNIYIIDAAISQFRETEVPDIIARMYIRNGLIELLGVEKQGTCTAEIHVANALRQHGRYISEENGTLKILRTGGIGKAQRIRSTIPTPLFNGKIYVSSAVETVYKERMKMEMDKYPLWHDDFLDSLAWLYQMVKDYNRWQFFDYEEEDTDELLSIYSGRNRITGY